MIRITFIPALTLLVCAAACSPAVEDSGPPVADRVFTNGAIYTVADEQPWAEAIAIADGRIVYVGDTDGALARAGDNTDVVDLHGQMMLPGFHDSHIHLLIGVMADDECSLLRIETAEEVAAELESCMRLAGIGDDGWILGGGWGEWLWADANPQKEMLDTLFPNRPVYLVSSFGHAAWVNSRALELAGIDDDTPDPPAGIIERNPETGEASGTLRESAMGLVERHVPPMSIDQDMKRVRAGIDLAHSYGITAVIEPGLDDRQLQPILALEQNGELDLRVLASLSTLNWHAGVFDDRIYDLVAERDKWRRPNLGVDSVKIYMDGVIEYGTSPLLEPYNDPDYGSGEFFYTQEQVNAYFTRFDELGLQVHVHAIGDAAIRRALDGFEAMRAANGMSDNRHHIVHLQLIDDDDRPRFGELNVTATFQALWAYPDPAAMQLDVPMLGRERTWQMYPIKSVRDLGGRIAGGSDYFVTDLNPLHAIEVAVTRQDPYTDAGPVLNETERVDLETMIRAYTINGAYLHKLEDRQGSIEVGKRADVVILDRNLFDIPPAEINEARVTMTIFDGRTVFDGAKSN